MTLPAFWLLININGGYVGPPVPFNDRQDCFRAAGVASMLVGASMTARCLDTRTGQMVGMYGRAG